MSGKNKVEDNYMTNDTVIIEEGNSKGETDESEFQFDSGDDSSCTNTFKRMCSLT
jgi:hypothetical protein